METINTIGIDIAVELGATKMPVHQLLRMGRGAVIELDTKEDDDLILMANNTPIARGQVMLQDDKILISVIELLPRPPEKRGGGGLRTFGGQKPQLDADELTVGSADGHGAAADEAEAAENVPLDGAIPVMEAPEPEFS